MASLLVPAKSAVSGVASRPAAYFQMFCAVPPWYRFA